MRNNTPEDDRKQGQTQPLKTGSVDQDSATIFQGSLAELNSLDVVPQLGNLSAKSVSVILAALQSKETIQIPANTKIELEQEGLIESLSDSTYQLRSEEILGLAAATADRKSQTESLEKLQLTVNDLTEKLNSGWHRFWTLHWLGFSRLDREQQALDSAKAQLPAAQVVQQEAVRMHDHLVETQGNLSRFCQTSEGYLAVTALGSSFLKDIVNFDRAFPRASYTQLSQTLASCDSVLESYQEARRARLYSGYAAAPLTALCATSNKPMEELVSIYQRIGSSHGVYSGHDVPSLVQAVIQSGKEVHEVMEYYNEVKQLGLYSGHHAAYLTAMGLRARMSPHDLVSKYQELRSSGSLYSGHDVPALLATHLITGKPIAHVMELYHEFRSQGLYSGHDAKVLANLAAVTNKSVEEIMEVYKGFREQSLYTGHHVAQLTALSALSGRSLNQVMAYYNKVRQQPLYSGRDIATLSSAAIGVLRGSEFFANGDDSSSSLHSTHSSADTDVGVGFNIGWAVAGDLIDNGTLDLSGGFIAGGMLGNAFD